MQEVVMSYRRPVNRNHKKEQERRLRIRKNVIRMCGIALVFIAVVACALIIGKSAVSTRAASASSGDKYYKSVTIQNGDTLWSIAEEYMDPNEYSDIRVYINEIKSINNLRSDTITHGQHLIVSYYKHD